MGNEKPSVRRRGGAQKNAKKGGLSGKKGGELPALGKDPRPQRRSVPEEGKRTAASRITNKDRKRPDVFGAGHGRGGPNGGGKKSKRPLQQGPEREEMIFGRLEKVEGGEGQNSSAPNSHHYRGRGRKDKRGNMIPNPSRIDVSHLGTTQDQAIPRGTHLLAAQKNANSEFYSRLVPEIKGGTI